MGGRGSGGMRVGSGRKPKDRAVAFLHGKEGATPASKPSSHREHVDPPIGLPAEQLATWRALAPHALAARTLTVATAQAFRDLCDAIVMKRAMLDQIEKDGLTYVKVTVDGTGTEHSELKAHPLISQHRGMMQRVEAGMARFRLAPVGKEIMPPDKPEDPFAEFDGETVQ